MTGFFITGSGILDMSLSDNKQELIITTKGEDSVTETRYSSIHDIKKLENALADMRFEMERAELEKLSSTGLAVRTDNTYPETELSQPETT